MTTVATDFAGLSGLLEEHLLLSLAVLTRVTAMLLAVPAIGSGIPARFRVVLAVLTTLLIVPSLASTVSVVAAHAIDLLILLAREAAVGLLIGTAIRILVSGMQLAGEVMSSSGGLQLGESSDPSTQAALPTLAQLIGLLAVATMFLIGGHRQILGSLIDSFVALPPGAVRLDESLLELLVSQLTHAFATGFRVAAPVVVAMLISNLVTGLISRTLPQLNVLAIGLSLNTVALLAVAALSIGSAGYLFQDEFATTLDRLAVLWAPS